MERGWGREGDRGAGFQSVLTDCVMVAVVRRRGWGQVLTKAGKLTGNKMNLQINILTSYNIANSFYLIGVSYYNHTVKCKMQF